MVAQKLAAVEGHVVVRVGWAGVVMAERQEAGNVEAGSLDAERS
jgi:hypothetical protein